MNCVVILEESAEISFPINLIAKIFEQIKDKIVENIFMTIPHE